MSEMLNSFNQIIDYNFNNLDNIKKEYGTVEALVENTDSAKVVVKLRDYITGDEEDNDRNARFAFLNKTGERLSIGDNVLIYYWNTITDGYVAIKIGLSTEPIIHPDMTADYNFVMTDDLDTILEISDNVHYLYFNPEFIPYDWGS